MHILSLPWEPGMILSGLEATGDLGDYGKARQKTETVGMMGDKEYQGDWDFMIAEGIGKTKARVGPCFLLSLGSCVDGSPFERIS